MNRKCLKNVLSVLDLDKPILSLLSKPYSVITYVVCVLCHSILSHLDLVCRRTSIICGYYVTKTLEHPQILVFLVGREIGSGTSSLRVQKDYPAVTETGWMETALSCAGTAPWCMVLLVMWRGGGGGGSDWKKPHLS